MKKLALFAVLTTLVLAGCTENNIDTTRPTVILPDLTAELSEEPTRTYVENNKYLRWHEADLITAFYGNALNRQYKFNGVTGANSGTFSLVPSGELGTGNTLGAIYAVYPYDATASITDEGAISLTLPATQLYAENSFGKGANTMIAVTENIEDTFLSFKNACGYIKLKLYNAEGVRVKSIEVKGNNEEKIAGSATATIGFGSAPELAMSEDATTTVTLDCGEQGVALGTTAETATEFWIVLPEITFEGGITISVTDELGGVFTRETNNKVAIIRNDIQPMAALNADVFEGSIPNNQIWYTATEKIEPYNSTSNGFGANIVSNIWDSATSNGVITFDSDITAIGDKAFSDCTSLAGVQIPLSVTSIKSRAFQNTGLTEIIIHDNVKYIQSNAFLDCVNLKNITLGKSITTLDVSAFSGVNNITLKVRCNIPDKTTSDLANSKSRFGTATIKSVIIDTPVTEIGACAFYRQSSLIEVTMLEGIKTINEYAFRETGIKNIILPKSIECIESEAFCMSKLTEITIPDNVKMIYYSAFNRCADLGDIYCESIIPPVIYGGYPTEFLRSIKSDYKIYVPMQSVEVYSNAYGWENVKSHIVGYNY